MNKEELLGSLYHYRERLTNDHSRPGWSPWALSGALATLIWLLISLLKDEQLDVKTGIPLALVLYLVMPLIRFLPTVKGERNSVSRVYISLRNEVHESVYSTIYNILGLTTATFCAWVYMDLPNPYMGIFLGFSIAIVVFMASIFILSRMSILGLDIEQDSAPWVAKLKMVVFSIMFATIATILTGVILNTHNWNSFQLWQSGLILIGIYYVVQKLIIDFEGNPLLETINNLIDEVTFNKISISEAQNQLRVIWMGAEFTDVIAPNVADFIQVNEIFRDLLVKTQARCEEYMNSKEEDREYIANIILENVEECNEYEKTLLKKIEEVKRKLAYFYLLEWGTQSYKDIVGRLNEELLKSAEAAIQLRAFGAKLEEQEEEWEKQRNTEHRVGKRKKKRRPIRNRVPDFKNN